MTLRIGIVLLLIGAIAGATRVVAQSTGSDVALTYIPGSTLADGIYLVCNIGSDVSQADPHANARSVLVRFDETTRTFTAGRAISQLPGGHFVFTSLHASGPDVLMFGAGSYRSSDIYHSKTPVNSFASGVGTQYFAGLVNGQPAWTNSESGAVPVIARNSATRGLTPYC